MHNSFIYKDMTFEQASKGGFFVPTEEWKPLGDVNFVEAFNKDHKITKDTLIAYYPGAFGHFHAGHKSVIKSISRKLSKITDDYAIVIAPANTEYTTKKYGAWSKNASNKHRYDRIRNWEDSFEPRNVYIDLNPMLNHRVDQNFTDLLKDFVDRNVPEGYFGLRHTPIIVSGKDRDFSELDKHTDLVRTFMAPLVYDMSTSKDFPYYVIEKKHLYLRTYSSEKANLFNSYLGRFYKEFSMIDIKIERSMFDSRYNKSAYPTPITITNCKDYKDLFPYFKLSRKYEHPLANPYFTDEQFEEFLSLKKSKGNNQIVVIDSDEFSGNTVRELQNRGFSMVVYTSLKNETDYKELLDFDDFADVNFRYPYYDLSSKCSLPAFTPKMHDLIRKLNDMINFEGL